MTAAVVAKLIYDLVERRDRSLTDIKNAFSADLINSHQASDMALTVDVLFRQHVLFVLEHEHLPP